jgi:hypothetical protein
MKDGKLNQKTQAQRRDEMRGVLGSQTYRDADRRHAGKVRRPLGLLLVSCCTSAQSPSRELHARMYGVTSISNRDFIC